MLNQKNRALQVLKNLASDNKEVIQQEDKDSSLPLGVSLWGMELTADRQQLFGPSEGRFGQQFNLAVNEILKMTEVEFNRASRGRLLPQSALVSQSVFAPQSAPKSTLPAVLADDEGTVAADVSFSSSSTEEQVAPRKGKRG